jgi:mannose-6-phosphate isomerase-like protein (cupin superfamily)
MTSKSLPRSTGAYLLEPNEGQSIDNLGLRLLATDQETDGRFLAAVVTNPGPGGPPIHTHASIDEMYFVLQGRYRFTIGGRESVGGPSTFVYVPRGTSHTFSSEGPEEGQLLFVTLPGTLAFLQGISDLQAAGHDQREMVEHFRTFESELDQPSLGGDA